MFYGVFYKISLSGHAVVIHTSPGPVYNGKPFLDVFWPTSVIISMQQRGLFPTVQSAEAMVAIRVYFLMRSSLKQKFGSEYKSKSENFNSLSLYHVTVTTISTNAKY